MLCVLGIAAVLIALIKRGGGGGFTWPDRPAGPLGPSGPAPGARSTSIVTRCATGASTKCDDCLVHRALRGTERRALPAGQ